MYGTFWLISGLIAVFIVCFSNVKVFTGMVRKTNFLIVFGVFILAILGGGFTLVFSILYAALWRIKA
jgi:hypothetical protein